jgi:hypothetical protein
MTGSSAGEATLAAGEERWQRLPPWLRPRTVELKGGGNLRLIETTLLVLVGLLLAIATVNDLARQTRINHRLMADVRTWQHYTGHDYHNISVDQELLGENSQREVLCGNTAPGPPQARTQICLVIWGPVVSGRRTVHGGWYLPAFVEDVRAERYGCFGSAAQGLCQR